MPAGGIRAERAVARLRSWPSIKKDQIQPGTAAITALPETAGKHGDLALRFRGFVEDLHVSRQTRDDVHLCCSAGRFDIAIGHGGTDDLMFGD